VIVSSRLADERLWAEVLNLGGYDVLGMPFEPEKVLRVADSAWRAWKRNQGDISRRTAASSATAFGSAAETPTFYGSVL
jgi:hypothetical protein